ncbi:MAG: hypothetical protein KatS3mg098_082 [Candidatus Parcubacteria bacterium]|mgnify:CR=1 FL=1|nr:MAG: hypothetical protein KatS3mg098_082 [Candidatus Parcubacteria bacterium]
MENHFCQIHKSGFAKAAALVMGGIYTLCAVFVALWPSLGLKLFGYLVHLVNLNVTTRVTGEGFVIGLFEVLVYTYVIAWLIAWLHNKFCGKNNE